MPALLVSVIDKKKIRNVLRKTYIERSRVILLKDVIKKPFEEKVIELVNIGVPNLWGILRMGFYGHVMRCGVGRGFGETNEIDGAEMKR